MSQVGSAIADIARIMVHTSSYTRRLSASRLYQGMMWSGLAVTAISMASLVLFSIYHQLSGALVGPGVEGPISRVWLIGVVTLAAGAGLALIGWAMGAESEPTRAVEPEPKARHTVAA